MEGSSYVDLFATKGIEYILVIGFLVALTLFWKLVIARGGAESGGIGELARAIPRVDWFALAPELYYHQGHSWAAPREGGLVRVGMDDFSGKLLGEIRSLRLPHVGEKVNQGEKGWECVIDSVSIPVLSPVDGVVSRLNEEAISSPTLIGNEPYGAGWLMEIKVPNVKRNLRNLLTGETAAAWMGHVVNRMRTKLTGELGVVLQDGGVIMSGIARNISTSEWPDTAREFLMTQEV